MNAVLAMARKDIKLIFTSKATIFFTFIFPLLFVVLFGSLLGGNNSDRKMTVALVLPATLDEGAQTFVAQLRQATELEITELNLIDAQTAVRKGKLVAYIEIPAAFSAQWQRVFSGTPPQLNVGTDPSRAAEAAMLEGVLMKYAASRFEQAFKNPAMMSDQLQQLNADITRNNDIDNEWKTLLNDYLPKIQQLMEKSTTSTTNGSAPKGPDMRPLVVQRVDVSRQRSGPPNAYSVLFPQAIVWAMLGGMMGFGVSLAKERSRGTLLRLLAAPMPTRAILFGKATACLLTLLTTATAIMVLGVLLFSVPIQNILILALALLAVALAFTGMMLLLTVIAKTEEAIGGGGWGIFMVLSMIGGNMIPLFLMPSWMQNVAMISPIRWAIVSLEGAIWREYTIAEMLLPIAVLLVLSSLCYGAAIRLFQRDWITP